MAENTVTIKTVFEGKEQLRQYKADMDLASKSLQRIDLEQRNGILTQKQALTAVDGVMKGVKAYGYGLLDTVKIETQAYHVQRRIETNWRSMGDALGGISDKMSPATQALKNFYREQRVQDRTLRESSAALAGFASMFGGGGAFTNAIQGAVGGIQQTEFALTGMGIAASSAGGAMAKMAPILLAAAGPLSALVGGAALLVAWFSAAKTETKDLTNNIDDLRYALGIYNDEQMRSILLVRIKLAQDELEKAKKEAAGAIPWGTFFDFSMGAQGVASILDPIVLAEGQFANLSKGMKAIEPQLEGLLGAQKALKDFDDKAAKEREKNKDKEREKNKDIVEALSAEETGLALVNDKWAKQFEIMSKVSDHMKLRPSERLDYIKRQAPGAPTLAKEVKPVTLADTLKEMDKAGKELNGFESSFNSAFGRMNNTIGDSIGGGLVEAFGIGHTLLGQFIADFSAQIMSLTTMGIIKGLFSLGSGGFGAGFLSVFKFASGGWINEPVYGVGKSGKRYMIGEEGPEYVSPRRMNQIGMASRGGEQRIIVELAGGVTLSGDQLNIALEKAMPKIRARRA